MTTPFEANINGKPVSTTVFPSHFDSVEMRKNAAVRASQRRIPSTVLHAMHDINSPFLNDARKRNLESLSAGKVAAVVTGQQVGLFGGPLLTFYKIVTAYKAAHALSQESGVPCIPIFWLQAEDHDFAEINSCNLLDTVGNIVSLELSDDPTLSRHSVEYRKLPADTEQTVSQLTEVIGSFSESKFVIDSLSRNYQAGRSVVSAFQGFLADIFPDLLFINPRHPGLSETSRPIYEKCLSDYRRLSKLLLENNALLEKEGRSLLVHVRPDSPLFFFHDTSPEGPRFRLQESGDKWNFIGDASEIGTAELSRLVRESPLRFSSSALLRPIVQDTLLPTAIYVGGPAEVNYFAQARPLFSEFGLEMPIVLPRASFTLLEEKTRKYLGLLALKSSDLTRPDEEILQLLAKNQGNGAANVDSVKAKVGELRAGISQTLKQAIEQTDTTLLGSLEKTDQKLDSALDTLLGRLVKAVATKDEITQSRLQRVKDWLTPSTPHGTKLEQERFFGFVYFLSRYGLGLRNTVETAITPFTPERKDLDL